MEAILANYELPKEIVHEHKQCDRFAQLYQTVIVRDHALAVVSYNLPKLCFYNLTKQEYGHHSGTYQ